MVTITEKKGACFTCSYLMSLVNLMLFIIIAAVTAHLVDGFFDGKIAIVALMTREFSIIALAFFALLASSVGIATSILGFVHAKVSCCSRFTHFRLRDMLPVSDVLLCQPASALTSAL
jgi:hypothetical protein